MNDDRAAWDMFVVASLRYHSDNHDRETGIKLYPEIAVENAIKMADAIMIERSKRFPPKANE